MSYKNIGIKQETFDLLDKCKEEYLNHHKDLKHIPLSKNKILYEVCKYYLEH